MNYFQRLWTKLDRSSKLNLLFIDIAIGALLVFILALCISRHETDSIILMSVSIPVFLIGIPLMFGSTRLKEIEKWEKEEAKDRQDFLNDEDGYLDNMAARVKTVIYSSNLLDLVQKVLINLLKTTLLGQLAFLELRM